MTQRKSSKDKTSNLFNRYVWLVDLIYRNGDISFEEINDHWCRSSLNQDGDDLPLRTFHNHRAAIEEMFDIIIDCDKRNGYKYFIENANDMERGEVRSWLLNTFAVNNLINESHKLKKRILFEEIPSGRKYLTALIEAMRDHISVEMTYQSFWRDAPRTFAIEPYCVKVFKQRWYVIANTPHYDTNSIRIYSLDRITALNTTTEKYSYPKNFDPQGYFQDCFGIIVDENIKTELISIKANATKSKYLRALPLHHSQEETEIGEDDSIFQYYLRPTYDFVQELLSHGDEIEVLKPKSLKKEIGEIISNLSKIYT